MLNCNENVMTQKKKKPSIGIHHCTLNLTLRAVSGCQGYRIYSMNLRNSFTSDFLRSQFEIISQCFICIVLSLILCFMKNYLFEDSKCHSVLDLLRSVALEILHLTLHTVNLVFCANFVLKMIFVFEGQEWKVQSPKLIQNSAVLSWNLFFVSELGVQSQK